MVVLFIRELDIKGGTHKQFYYLADYLKRNKVEFKIITTAYNLKLTYESFRDLEENIICIERKLSSNPFVKIYYYFEFLFNLRRELKGASLLNIHDNGLQLLFPFIADNKMIWQINDLPVEFRVGVNKEDALSLFNIIKKNYIKWSVKFFVEKITVNVSKNKERIKQAIGVSADVLYCGIEKINVERDIAKSFHRFKNKQINVLSSGVFLPYRNYETSIKVIKKLILQGFKVKLDIIGNTTVDPQYTEKIEQLVKQEGLESEISILGQIDEQEFIALHQNADIFMFINVDQSWGLAVFEAMSCGIPVIVSNNVGATEILRNNQDAIFVDPLNENEIVDHIHQLTSDEILYRKFSESGVLFANNYSWDNSYSSKVSELIKKLSN